VRPGITDPASLAFRNEAELLAASSDPEREYIEVVMLEKLKLAADYAGRASMTSDLQLILATIARMFRG
jgi:lipopolysaccharide/colanic/teichoic acid biosynthesis glycosyltransferase